MKEGPACACRAADLRLVVFNPRLPMQPALCSRCGRDYLTHPVLAALIAKADGPPPRGAAA